ncbi:Protein FAM101B, partial [Myotis davidii]
NPASLPTPLASACAPRLCPLSFGEGVEFDPLPPTEVRYTSSVKYDSDRHFIDDVRLPLGLAVASCSQTVTCIPNCTLDIFRMTFQTSFLTKPGLGEATRLQSWVLAAVAVAREKEKLPASCPRRL